MKPIVFPVDGEAAAIARFTARWDALPAEERTLATFQRIIQEQIVAELVRAVGAAFEDEMVDEVERKLEASMRYGRLRRTVTEITEQEQRRRRVEG